MNPLWRASIRLSAPSQFAQLRPYAVQTGAAHAVEIFSSKAKWQQKERAAANVDMSRKVDYLRDEVATRLCERLLVDTRESLK
jgi:hypothetical protein